MSAPSEPGSPPSAPSPVRLFYPRVPTAEEWAAMSPAQQDRAVEDILDVLDSQREAMGEGTRHSRPKVRALTHLTEHFQRARRRVFLATELTVLYAGEDAIVPDLLAVLDTDPEKEVDSWVVMRERRGIDLVIEFRNRVKKHKDLEANVRDYAHLGISEYFAMDCLGLQLQGWRLPKPESRTYVPLLGQGGRFLSQVLDLDLAIVGGRLRFFQNQAQIPESGELVDRLEGMVGERDRKLEEAERARQDAENRRQDAERQRQDAVRQRDDGLQRVSARVLARLAARGVPVSEAQQARIRDCTDIDQLLDWLDRAAEAPSAEALLG